MNGPTMAFGNLPAQDQPDPGTAGLRGIERNEEIAGFAQPRAIIFDE
jgi:hypothetical protein